MMFRYPIGADSSDYDRYANVFQQLEWVVKTNKATYLPGEPIGIRVYLRNNSSEDVIVFRTPDSTFTPSGFLNSMQVKRILNENKWEVNLTGEGFRINYHNFRPVGRKTWPGRILHPGDKAGVSPFENKTLNRYYDLSLEGEYELTFYTRDFLADDEHQIGEYPKCCTVCFKIEGNTNWLDKQVVWSEGRGGIRPV